MNANARELFKLLALPLRSLKARVARTCNATDLAMLIRVHSCVLRRFSRSADRRVRVFQTRCPQLADSAVRAPLVAALPLLRSLAVQLHCPRLDIAELLGQSK